MSPFPCTLWPSSHERKSHTLCAAHDERDTKDDLARVDNSLCQHTIGETDKGIKEQLQHAWSYETLLQLRN